MRASADGRLRVDAMVSPGRGVNPPEAAGNRIARFQGKPTVTNREDRLCVGARLYAPDGEPIAELAPEAVEATPGLYDTDARPPMSARLETLVAQPQLWSDDTPRLYTLVLSLYDAEGRAVDHERVRVGFRDISLEGGLLRLNGTPVTIRGTNRHEFNAVRGRAVTEADMVADIRQMKRLNINAVRSCTYPNQPRWYELCDEWGLLVMSEAAVETHEAGTRFSVDPAWAETYLERAKRMALQKKNHPCIFVWSLGNEAGTGPNFAAMANWLREFDPSRPIHYNARGASRHITDLRGDMYPKRDWVRESLSDPQSPPLIMSEYAYQRGNAGSCVEEIWEEIDRLPRFQGGFIWEWADKALPHRDGEEAWAYGGDFGEAHVDESPSMVLNGFVFADLSPKPQTYELMRAHAPVQIEADDNGAERYPDHLLAVRERRFRVRNRHHAHRLEGYELHWSFKVDGEPVAEGCRALPRVEPGGTGRLCLEEVDTAALATGELNTLDLRIVQREATPWADAGHLVSWRQYRYPRLRANSEADAAAADPAPTDTAGVAVSTEADGAYTIRAGAGAVYRVDPANGFFRLSRSEAPDEALLEGMKPNYYRALVDNDLGIDYAPTPLYGEIWREAGLDRLETVCQGCECLPHPEGRSAVIRLRFASQVGADRPAIHTGVQLSFRPEGCCEVAVTAQVPEACPPLPRIGLRLRADRALARLRWCGRGPWETYPDRKNAAWFDIHTSTVAEQLTPYVVPSECGAHTDTHWFELKDDGGNRALRIDADGSLIFSALPVSQEQLAATTHHHNLKAEDWTHLHLDGFHTGVGGDNGWTGNIHEPYLLHPGTYRYGFTISQSETWR